MTDSRQLEALRLMQRDQGRSDRRRRAAQLIRDRMPDLLDEHGRPCSYAVWAVLRLWARHGEGNVRAAQLRAERAQLLPVVEQQEASS